MTTPPGDQIAIELGLPLVAYSGDQVPIKVPQDPIVPPIPVTVYKNRSWGALWGLAPFLPRSSRVRWGSGSRRTSESRLLSSKATRIPVETVLSWSVAQNLRYEVECLGGSSPRVQKSVRVPWAGIPRVSVLDTQVSWRSLPRKPRSWTAPWRNPPRVPGEARVSYGLATRVRVQDTRFSWGGLSLLPLRWKIPWGTATRVPWIPGSPGFNPPGEPEPPGYVAPAGDRVYIRLLCPLYNYPGDQVPIRVAPSQCYFDFPGRRTYVVENIVDVVRLPERTRINVKQISLSISTDSVFWDFRAQLARPDDLGYLKKDSSGPKELEVTINGHVWRVMVEDHDEDRTFEEKSVSILGRSRTCILDTPWAPIRSRTETATRTAQQLMEFEVDSTGFTIEHLEVDWAVPANLWTYQGLSPIGAIKAVAEASGSVVQSHPWDSKLIVYPRYPVSPWDWTSSTPDNVIYDGTVSRIGTRNKSLPMYDYVFVSGEVVGVGDEIIREGSSGETRKPMQTHLLICTHPVALERGRNELGDRGEQALISLQLPLFPVSTSPGLVSVMDLVQIEEEPTGWRGQVVSTTIEVSTSSDGTLSVWQTPTIERHYSDAD